MLKALIAKLFGFDKEIQELRLPHLGSLDIQLPRYLVL